MKHVRFEYFFVITEGKHNVTRKFLPVWVPYNKSVIYLKNMISLYNLFHNFVYVYTSNVHMAKYQT